MSNEIYNEPITKTIKMRSVNPVYVTGLFVKLQATGVLTVYVKASEPENPEKKGFAALVNFKPVKDEYLDPVTCRFKLVHNTSSGGSGSNSKRIISSGNSKSSWEFTCNDGVWSMNQQDQQQIIDYRKKELEKKKQREKRQKQKERRLQLLRKKKEQQRLRQFRKRQIEKKRKERQDRYGYKKSVFLKEQRKKRKRTYTEHKKVVENHYQITKMSKKEQYEKRQDYIKKGIIRPVNYFHSKLGDKYYKEKCSVNWCQRKVWYVRQLKHGEELVAFKYKYKGQCPDCGEDAILYIPRNEDSSI